MNSTAGPRKRDAAMTPTDRLRKENETIRVALAILNSIVGKLDSSHDVPVQDLDDIVELIRVLVQRLHRRREEDVILATLEDSPVNERGAFAALLTDHRAMRRSFEAMRASAARYHAGDQGARPAVSENARRYAEGLSEHLEGAEKDFYVRVDIHLSRKKQRELSLKFDVLDTTIAERDEQLRKLEKLRRAYLE